MLSAETLQLARCVVREATEAHVTLGSAESCTGGLVSAAITSIPGSSEPWMGGVCSYACSVKESILGVSHATLTSAGAVSVECAEQMATGATKALGCQIAVSTTGIAGPGGAVEGKPVGTVCFALATPQSCVSSREQFDGDRDAVREASVAHALQLLREGIAEVVRSR